MKVLIIEDERRAVNQLENMLQSCGFTYELLGDLDSVEDSVAWFKHHEEPDLVFMDIQLADGLSFEIFQKVSVEAPIIFTTAFDQYAIQAFKVNSIDYLLKPIKKEDLQGALDKFLSARKSLAVAPDILQQLLGSMQAKSYRDGILVKEGSGFVRVRVEDVLYFYSEDSITFAVTVEKRFIIEETIDRLVTTLDPNQFFQINRGQIVCKSSVAKIESYFNHRLKLTINTTRQHEFVVGRAKVADFKSWINN